MTATLPAALAAAGGVVRPELQKLTAALEPGVREVVGYHLGWIDAQGNPTDGGGGKALRPALALLSADAVGADIDTALPGAVAVELVHNFSLLHDDVMDGDVERRHRPTAWRLYGMPAAILAGDALLTSAWSVLQERGPAAISCVSDTVQRLIAGQSLDVEFERRDGVSLAECLTMAAGKTGALMCCASSIGAVLAEAPAASIEALAQFGEHVGLAFQLVDDLLGIWGRPEVTGKAVLSDLRVRKKTVPVVAALNSETAAARTLGRLYRDPGRRSEAELHRMAELIEEAGGLAWTRHEADRQVRYARECLDRLGAPAQVRDALWEIATFITEREL